MKNIFKEAVDDLILDFNDYDYLLGDLEVGLFHRNHYLKFLNNTSFIDVYPVTHNFIVLVCIIEYIGVIEGSARIDNINLWEEQVEKYILNYLDLRTDIFSIVLKGYRKEFYKFIKSKKYGGEPFELINAGNALIPIMKYMYRCSDEFK